MSALVPVLLVGGGFAYVAAQESVIVPPPRPPNAPAILSVASSRTIAQTILMSSKARASSTFVSNIRDSGERKPSAAAPVTNQIMTGWLYNPTTIDSETQKKLNAIQAAAKKNFEDMDAVAKAAAADKLNKELKLDPPLTGRESWAAVAAVVTAAVGAAAGTALCGPLCGKVGALCGAYLGEKLGPLMEKKWSELESYIGDKWGDVREAAQDAVDYVQNIF